MGYLSQYSPVENIHRIKFLATLSNLKISTETDGQKDIDNLFWKMSSRSQTIENCHTRYNIITHSITGHQSQQRYSQYLENY